MTGRGGPGGWWTVLLLTGCGASVAAVAVEDPPEAAVGPTLVFAQAEAAAEPDPILSVLGEELRRAQTALAQRPSGAPYFIGYQVTDRKGIQLYASDGAMAQARENHTRWLDVDLRVGDYSLDRQFFPTYDSGNSFRQFFPTYDSGNSFRHTIRNSFRHTIFRNCPPA